MFIVLCLLFVICCLIPTTLKVEVLICSFDLFIQINQCVICLISGIFLGICFNFVIVFILIINVSCVISFLRDLKHKAYVDNLDFLFLCEIYVYDV